MQCPYCTSSPNYMHMQEEDRLSVPSVASVFDRQELLRDTEDYTMELSPLNVITVHVASLFNMQQP